MPVTNIQLNNFGSKKGELAEAWLTRAERILRVGGERRSKYVAFLSLRLEGNASTWFDQLRSDVVLDYRVFREALLLQFQLDSTCTYAATLRMLDHIKHEVGERVSAYGIHFGKA